MSILAPISDADYEARLARVLEIAHQLGFVGEVQYRHAISTSGGATFMAVKYLMSALMRDDCFEGEVFTAGIA